MLRVFNKADWLVNNPEWLQERKAKWQLLQEKLLLSEGYVKKPHLPVYRDFYLTGKLDLDAFYSAQGCSFMLMLLHPRPSLEMFKLIYDNIDSINDMDCSIRHLKHYSMVSHCAAKKELYGEKVYKAFGTTGLLDGLDKLYTQVFWGQSCDEPRKVDAVSGRTYPYVEDNIKTFFSSYLWPATFFMLGITKYHYAREQYQAEYWYSSVKHNNQSFLQTKEAMTAFFQSIYYFDKLDIGDGVHGRKQLADELKSILDSMEFPPKIKELWQRTKQLETQCFEVLNGWRSEYGLPTLRI